MLKQLNIYEVYNIYYKDITKFMIFLDNNHAINVKIPKNWGYPVVYLELVILNKFTNVKTIYNNVQLEETELYYVLENIDLTKLPTGEYEYILTDKMHNVIVSKGLIQIGPREINNLHYNGKEQYIEYGK